MRNWSNESCLSVLFLKCLKKCEMEWRERMFCSFAFNRVIGVCRQLYISCMGSVLPVFLKYKTHLHWKTSYHISVCNCFFAQFRLSNQENVGWEMRTWLLIAIILALTVRNLQLFKTNSCIFKYFTPDVCLDERRRHAQSQSKTQAL